MIEYYKPANEIPVKIQCYFKTLHLIIKYFYNKNIVL